MSTSATVIGLLTTTVLTVPESVPIVAVKTPLTPLLGGSSFIFTAIAPKIIQSHSAYCVYVTVDKAETAVRFSISVNATDENYSAEMEVLDPLTSRKICVPVPQLKSALKRYNLCVKAQHGKNEIYENQTYIFVDSKIVSLLVQTDKPIYKPGETVKFRVILLDRQLKPLQQSKLTVFSKDPQGNVIKKWADVETNGGMFSSEILLSAEPNLGDWILEVVSDLGEQESHTFTVDQYVLPKFKTEVKLPPFAIYNESKIQAEITAMYTYGKGVKGEAVVTLSEYSPYRFYRPFYRRGRFMEPITVVKTVPIEGTAFVEFDIMKEMQLPKNMNYEKEFQVDAVVIESVTSKKQNGTSRITLYEYPWKIELVDLPQKYKPGFPLTLTIKVSSQNNVPVHDSDPKALTIKHGFAYTEEEGIQTMSIPSNGLVIVTFQTPSNLRLTVNSIEVTYKSLTTQLYLPQKASSTSNIFMQVTPQKKLVGPGENVVVDFQANQPIRAITYMLYARGEIKKSKMLPNSEEGSKFIKNVEIQLPENIGTRVVLVAYGIFSVENEVVVDSVKINLKTPALHNFLNISASAKQVEPGKSLTISIESKDNSLVALRGVDQSVLILKEDKNIDMGTVDRELKTYENMATMYKVWGGSDSFQVMEDAGLAIITNGKLEKNTYYPRYEILPMAMAVRGEQMMDDDGSMEMEAAAPMMMMKAQGAANMAMEDASSQPPPRVRTEFPETWIWDHVQMNDSITTLDKTVPDTLTSWVISGFSLNPEFGIGVTLDSISVEVFRPFFITLNKPYAVVKGEILALQVLVHNYQSNDAEAKIVFDNKEKKFSFEEGDKNAESQTKTVSVKSKDVSSVTFLIVPETFGIVKLNVMGTTANSGDAISQPLIVKPPGQKQVGNEAILINLAKGQTFETKMKASFSEKRVEGADYMKVSVVGDLMGSAMKNLDKLLQMPSGCGEQNMLSFVPDLVILDYLEFTATTKPVDPAIRSKAIQFLECGYQRQLSYRRHDASFSAFGNSDPQGSTWLTAFVARSFISAKRYITVDDQIIDSALGFLAAKQDESGEFREYGKVIHSELQGGVDSASKGYAMTTFVLLAFLEASGKKFDGTSTGQIDPVVKKALNFITSIPTALSDSYALNLITYALEVANHPKKDEFFKRMEKLAKTEGTHKWWENPKSKEDNLYEQDCLRFHPWKKPTKSAAVEMTAYAALTYMKRGEVANAFPIIKWLLSQRNENGGFISTQDTVVGLTALGKFAQATKANDTDVNIAIIYGEGKSMNWTLNDENLDVLNEKEIPEAPRDISVQASGEGSALLQLTWSFYVEDIDKAPAFSISVKVINIICPLN